MWKQAIHKSIQHNQLEPEATVRDGSKIGEIVTFGGQKSNLN